MSTMCNTGYQVTGEQENDSILLIGCIPNKAAGDASENGWSN